MIINVTVSVARPAYIEMMSCDVLYGFSSCGDIDGIMRSIHLGRTKSDVSEGFSVKYMTHSCK